MYSGYNPLKTSIYITKPEQQLQGIYWSFR